MRGMRRVRMMFAAFVRKVGDPVNCYMKLPSVMGSVAR